jgi:Ca-activated chloride channel family protein
VIFENPEAFWFLLGLIPLLFFIGFWGWKEKRDITGIFPFIFGSLKRKQIEKYLLSCLVIVCLVIALAVPKASFASAVSTEKTGEIIFLVDGSLSMAAQADIDSLNRLERTKLIIDEIIDSVTEYEQVSLCLSSFTDIPTILVPFVGVDDYSYLEESLRKILTAESTPVDQGGTDVERSIRYILDKFGTDNGSKILVVFSDGENYVTSTGVANQEEIYFNQIVEQAIANGITVITVGVGETSGATIPIYYNGEFSGYYYQSNDEDYVTYLDEDRLKSLADATGGEYFFESNADELMEFIIDSLDTSVSSSNSSDDYQSLSPVFLTLSLALWIISTKRYLLN